MHNQEWWFRRTNFYEHGDFDMNREVMFQNYMTSEVMVRQIWVVYHPDEKTKIMFTPSSFKFDEFCLACHRILKEKFTPPLNHVDMIQLEFDANSLIDIIKLFDFLNIQSETEEFSALLVTELTRMCASLTMPPEEYYLQKHLIQELPPTWTEQIHPDKEKSNSIVALISQFYYRSPLNELEIQVKKLLVEGEDPNQKGEFGTTPLYWATFKPVIPNSIIHLLLCYGAKPWNLSTAASPMTAIELAKQFKYTQKFDLLTDAFRQSVTIYANPSTLTTAKTIDVFTNSNRIISFINLSNSHMIISEFKELAHLKLDELKRLFVLYSQIYQSANGDMSKAFEQAFKPDKGKFIDVLRDGTGRIIGADTYIVRQDGNDLYILVDLSFLHPDYQRCGLMPLIDYRLAFALQALNPDLNTHIVFLAASYSAWRRVEQLLCTPKYQPDNIKDRIKHIFTKVFNMPLIWVDAPDGVFFTVKEENQLTVSIKNKTPTTIMEEFFYKYLHTADDAYVPVLIPAGDNLLLALQKILSLRGINFNDQRLLMARALTKSTLLSKGLQLDSTKTSNDIAPNKIIKSKYLFWNNQYTPSTDNSLLENLELPQTKQQYTSNL